MAVGRPPLPPSPAGVPPQRRRGGFAGAGAAARSRGGAGGAWRGRARRGILPMAPESAGARPFSPSLASAPETWPGDEAAPPLPPTPARRPRHSVACAGTVSAPALPSRAAAPSTAIPPPPLHQWSLRTRQRVPRRQASLCSRAADARAAPWPPPATFGMGGLIRRRSAAAANWPLQPRPTKRGWTGGRWTGGGEPRGVAGARACRSERRVLLRGQDSCSIIQHPCLAVAVSAAGWRRSPPRPAAPRPPRPARRGCVARGPSAVPRRSRAPRYPGTPHRPGTSPVPGPRGHWPRFGPGAGGGHAQLRAARRAITASPKKKHERHPSAQMRRPAFRRARGDTASSRTSTTAPPQTYINAVRPPDTDMDADDNRNDDKPGPRASCRPRQPPKALQTATDRLDRRVIPSPHRARLRLPPATRHRREKLQKKKKSN